MLTEKERIEHRNISLRKYYLKNKQRFNNATRRYRNKLKKGNLEKYEENIQEYNKQYILKRREKDLKNFRAKVVEYKKRYKEKLKRENPEKYRSLQKEDCLRQKEHAKKKKRMVFEHYGLACICCGESTYEFLTIDHINNNGAAHREEVLGKGHSNVAGGPFYSWIVKSGFPEGLQTLCWNCNCGKRVGNGICPHKKETNNGIKLSTNEETGDSLVSNPQV